MSRLASAFPPIRELPAMFCAYALTALLVWMLTHPHTFFALVMRALGAIA
jgi:hypothetical protein